jgi:hypothetical protein
VDLSSCNESFTDIAAKFVGEFILGGIACLAIYVAYWAIKELKLAKNQHISALNTSADKADTRNEKHIQSYQKTADATVSAIETLTRTENTQTDAIRGLTNAVTSLKTSVDAQKATIDSVVRDAVRGRRIINEHWPTGGRKPEPDKRDR